MATERSWEQRSPRTYLKMLLAIGQFAASVAASFCCVLSLILWLFYEFDVKLAAIGFWTVFFAIMLVTRPGWYKHGDAYFQKHTHRMQNWASMWNPVGILLQLFRLVRPMF